MSKFYSLTAINKKNATYNVIFGERSNGKTYATLKQGIIDYCKNGGQMAYVRRWKEDITGRRASRLFSALCENGEIQKITVCILGNEVDLSCSPSDNAKEKHIISMSEYIAFPLSS